MHSSFALPFHNPVADIKPRKQTTQVRKAPYVPVMELLKAPKPAREKCSECFHRRNLTAVALTGGAGIRNEELRELNWEDLVAFALDPFASHAVGRLEDVLAGDFRLDDLRHALIATIHEPKDDTSRFVAVVAEFRDAVLAYAREYVRHRVENARSQRSDARERLRDHFGPAYADLDAGTYTLRFKGAGLFSRTLLETNHDRWASARNVFGPAALTWPDGTKDEVDEGVAEELLAYLISFADNARFGRAKEVFRRAENGWKVDPKERAWLRANPVLLGPVMFSRKGGAICEDQLRYIFEIYGWQTKGYLPQTLRSNWQRFHKKYMVLLLEGGAKALGHASSRVTGDAYDAEDVFDLVRIARRTARALRMITSGTETEDDEAA